MASLFNTELKEVVNTSDGDDLQLQENGSCHLLSAEVCGICLYDSEPLRRLKRTNDQRNSSHSASDHTEVKSLYKFEFNHMPNPWHEVEERMQSQAQYGRKIYDGRSLISPQFGDNENRRKWQSLKKV